MIAVIAVVGMCGSGKSEVSAYLERKGLPRVHFGSITMEEVQRRGLSVNEANERKVREELRQQYGMAAYALLSLPRIRELVEQGRTVLIDGLYSDAELKVLQEAFPGQVFVLGVFTEKRLRYARLANRPVRPLTAEEAASRDRMEIDHLEKAPPIALADAMVLNNGTLADLHAAVEAVIAPLITAGEIPVEGTAMPEPRKRADWHEYFMEIARVVATRSTCPRKHVGAVIVRDRTILSTGYNGSVRGLPHCDEVGCDIVGGHCVRTVHAEANAIIQAARNGVQIAGAELYTTASPCWECFKLIANAGLVCVYFGEFYRDDRCLKLADAAGIQVVDLSAQRSTQQKE